MPDFAYTARTLGGDRVTGTISAATQREASGQLAAKDLFPVQISATKGVVASEKAIKVRQKHIAVVFHQLASLIRSGVPLLRAITVIRDQSSQAGLKAVLDDVRSRIEDGATLGEAMARHPKAFPELAVSVVRAGGEGGFLEDALERVSKFIEQQEELKARVMGALAYPVIVGTLGFVVVNFLVIYFVPKFESLFATLRERGELPLLTDWVVWLSETLQVYGIFILAAAIAVVVLVQQKLATPEGRRWADRWRLKVPVAGDIHRSLAVGRFCRVLGTLLNGGVPIVRSLEISAEATGNSLLAATVRDAEENITRGETLAAPLAASGEVPRNVVEMIAVAEESNSLETVLIEVADTLERDTWRKLDLFVSLLEPLMLIALAGMVLVVVIALLLPVMKMSSAV